MSDYPESIFTGPEYQPSRTKLYCDVSDIYKITQLPTTNLGALTLTKWNYMCQVFTDNYDNREIAGSSEYDFFKRLSVCIAKNADTIERHLEVYDEDIAKPILGRTETVTFNRENNYLDSNIGQSDQIEVPADDPDNDTISIRDKNETSGNRDEFYKGTVETKLSDLGVKPNVETMNLFLEKNITFIKFFLDITEECFLGIYERIIMPGDF
jgi:hypothetical protein